MNLSDLGEFELIARLSKGLSSDDSVVVGVGDDTAVLRTPDPKKYLLYTVDSCVLGRHFDPDTPPFGVGWKAMARNLSDIAAMGGLPRWALVAVGFPRNLTEEYASELYRGMREIADTFNTRIVGGDTTRVSRETFISISLIGEVESDRVKLRSAAEPGDSILVTGLLGGSILGKHLEFTPRIREARWLVENFPVRAMMDLSDGLAGDIRRIMEQSRVGARLIAPRIPLSRDAYALENQTFLSALECALHGGEDFELLFTIAPDHVADLLKRWGDQFPKTPLTTIGSITEASALHRAEVSPGETKAGDLILVDRSGEEEPLTESGFDHFRQ